MARALALDVALLAAFMSLGEAQDGESAIRRDTVTAGAHYRAGWFHRLLLGAHYRDLWATPIEVPVLDLSTFAGGLTPGRCGGRRQTKSLRFVGADGREYVFRSVDKDPTLALPPDLRETFARALIQDQISSAHPGAPLVVAPLLDRAGVLHANPQIVTLPADSRLDRVDCVHAGMLGMIEERPTDPPDNETGFVGAADVAGTEKLFDQLEDSPDHRIDAPALLAARLMDVFIGDWDRHQDQWRWARFDSGGLHRWRPIPRDRDQAFSRLDGLLVSLAGIYQPQLVGFDDDYPSIWRLTYAGQFVDRRLLTGLERATWDSVAQRLRSRLTDSVIDAAVRALPPPYFERNGATLIRALRHRRDQLPHIAARFYALLAQVVEVHGTDRRDVAEAVRQPGGHLLLRLSSVQAGTAGAPYYQRSFTAAETQEVRVFLHGGDDKLVVYDSAADRSSGPLLRVVGGSGDDDLADSSRHGGTHFYDDDGNNRFTRGPGTSVDTHRYQAPPIDTVTLGRPRDWGSHTMPLVWAGYAPDLGFFIGGGVSRTGYGFRRLPHNTYMQFRAGYATTAATYRAEFKGDFHDIVAPAVLSLRARASGIDIIHFYGFGNETADTGSKELYKVRQQQYVVAPLLEFEIARPTRFAIGPIFKHARTESNAGSIIDATAPYGVPRFGQVGAIAALDIDTRDRPQAATRGVAVSLGGSLYPAALDATSTFGDLHAELSTYLTAPIPLRPTLAARVAGKKVWGSYPFHEAAFVGGWSTVRGLPEQRFAGDASLFGNVELRLPVATVFVLLPSELGVFGLADAGRVYLSGERSDRWHAAVGGGLWFAFLNRANTVSLAAADAGEGVRVYARAGFAF